ncbi:Protein of unknown function (DUF2508) [Halobacteroides halobius DSM 5150]|uniref:DUF2508 domain-containing protein n=1 Tax=Halobacteroides halobius (strain ATCC 35273 / DSM 5150 / MD-1) TaxID=748449 RepID=L0K4X4_HALHC|nr:DUF2508 family protein [Halobacteroides halobius]AGB40071.1 Protein of unknown function (DUF2508) [Halobacteroides halobius DSM 5150]
MAFEIIARVLNDSSLSTRVDEKLEEEIIEAQEEFNKARKYFDSVSDPDLIDHAIYRLKAAESKYTYLLKKKKDV